MFAYVGCYSTPERKGKGEGISVFHVTDPGKPWEFVQTLKTYDNPSFLRVSPDKTTLLTVHGGRSAVSAYAMDWSNGRIALLGQGDSKGNNPVDFGFTADHRHVLAAHYSSGTVSILPISAGGIPGDAIQVITIEGTPGPLGTKQPGPLPHGVTPDPTGQYLLVPDKGLDVVLVYKFESGVLREVSRAATTPGAGPRHAVFHPTLPLLYVVGELDCCVHVFDWRDGHLTHRQAEPGMKPLTPAVALASEIAISADGRALYSSNRGEDNIAHFAVADDGAIRLVETTKLPGQEPRFFAIDPGGRHLHVAQQFTDNIVCFDISPADGTLSSPRVVAEVKTPVAMAFLGGQA